MLKYSFKHTSIAEHLQKCTSQKKNLKYTREEVDIVLYGTILFFAHNVSQSSSRNTIFKCFYINKIAVITSHHLTTEPALRFVSSPLLQVQVP